MTNLRIYLSLFFALCLFTLSAQPFTFVNNGGDVSYTSNLTPSTLTFYLFGDGYFTKEKHPYHEFEAGSNYVTTMYYADNKTRYLLNFIKNQLVVLPILSGLLLMFKWDLM